MPQDGHSPSKTLPSAPAAEAEVLGATLSEGIGWWNLISRLAGSEPETLFYDPSYRMVAQAMAAAAGTDAGISSTSVEDQLRRLGGERLVLDPRSFLIQLQASSAITTLDSLRLSVSTLVSKRSLRMQLEGLDRIKGSILSTETEPSAVSSELRHLSMDHMVDRSARRMSEIIDEMESESSAPWCVPTGLSELDSILKGGYKPGKFYVFGARPKVGKTTLMNNSVLTALESGAVVLVVSMEMSREEIYVKMLSRHSMVEDSVVEDVVYRKCALGDIDPESADALRDARKFLRECDLHMSFAQDVPDTSDSVVSQMMALRAQYGEERPIIVFLDYMQLLSRDNYNKQAEISGFTRDFKLAATELKIPFVSLSQINRQATDGPPQSWMLKDSGSFEQDADAIILLHRQSMLDPEAPEHIMDVSVPLHRAGPNGEFQAVWRGEYAAVYDLESQFRHEEGDEPIQRGTRHRGRPFADEGDDDDFLD